MDPLPTSSPTDRVPARSCCSCRRTWADPKAAGIGWTPTAIGWTCPACSRRRDAYVERCARWLLARPDRSWLGTVPTPPRQRCRWSEVVYRATQIELGAPER